MTRGKIEYSPDYESNKFSDFFREQMKNPEFAAAYLKVDKEENNKLADALKREFEHQRLKDAVVEAAKARRIAKKAPVCGAGDYIQALHAAMVAENEAVDSLITFESAREREREDAGN